MRVVPSAKAAATKKIGNSSIIRGAISGRHVDGASAAEWRTRRSATGSPPARAGSRQAMSPPISRSSSNRPVRSRVHPDALDPKLRARDDQGRDGEEGGGRGVAGDGERLRPQAPASPRRTISSPSTAMSAPNSFSIRSLWSRVGDRLDDPGEAGDVERGEEQGRFHLRRGDVHAVGERAPPGRGRARSAAAGRRAPSPPRAPIRRSGAATRSIGRRDSEESPVKAAAIGWRGDEAHQQPRRSAAIAHVERAARAGAGRRLPTPSTVQAAAVAGRSARPSPAARRRWRGRRRRRDSPSIRLRPRAMAAQIRARWEIDLSPGTRAVPRSGPEAPNTVGRGPLVVHRPWLLTAGIPCGKRAAVRSEAAVFSNFRSGDFSPMVKPEWGTKRTCPKCGARFYDLGKEDPVTCLACGVAWDPEPVLKSKQPLPFDAPKKEVVVDEKEDADLAAEDLGHRRGCRGESGRRGRSGRRRRYRRARGRGRRRGGLISVVPAKAGTSAGECSALHPGTPAFAGVTEERRQCLQ